MADMKKDFQKAVKVFRDELPAVGFYRDNLGMQHEMRPEYPKAMMTAQQERKKTATVNFGRESQKDNWTAAEAFMEHPAFVAWLEKYAILSARIETSNDHNVQIRVNW